MERSKKQEVLTKWDFRFNDTYYQADFYDLFADFVNNKKILKVPYGYAVFIIGYIVRDTNGIEDKDLTRTLPITSIKKIDNRNLIKKTGLFWWESDEVKRVFCAIAENGNEYYFRLRRASDDVKSRLNYISSCR